MNQTELYNGKVLCRFNAGNHRYSISVDGGVTWDYKQGVTGILGKTLAKEALALWPMDEALGYLFGQKFDEQLQDDGSVLVRPLYEPSKALLKPDRTYSRLEFQDALETARGAFLAKRDRGGDVGHLVHAAIEAFLNGRSVIISDPQAQKAFDAFKGWFVAQELTVVATERVVYSHKLDYCGTFDALFEMGGKKILVDFKTSNASRTAPKGIYAEGFLQLGAYTLAYEEEHGQSVDDVMVLNCSKQGKVNTQLASDLGYSPVTLGSLFHSLLIVHRAKADMEKQLSKKEVKQ